MPNRVHFHVFFKIENEKKQSYILHTDEKYKYSFGKEFYTRTLNRVKPILNDIKQNHPSTPMNKKLKSIIRKKCENLKCQFIEVAPCDAFDEDQSEGGPAPMGGRRRKNKTRKKKRT